MSDSSRSPLSVCVVGAGLAGLAAAHALAAAGVPATVLDKSRGVSGRAATRWRDIPGSDGAPVRWRVDHGAQVFTPEPGSPADRLVRRILAPDALAEIAGAVVPFDDDGTLRPERTRGGGPPRLAFRDGYAALGRALAPPAGLHLNTTATRLVREAGGWTVEVTTPEGDARLGPFQAVVLTPPAPQAAEIVAASAFDTDLRDGLARALAAATYRAQFSVVLAFAEPVALPGGAYALVNAVDGGERRPPRQRKAEQPADDAERRELADDAEPAQRHQRAHAHIGHAKAQESEAATAFHARPIAQSTGDGFTPHPREGFTPHPREGFIPRSAAAWCDGARPRKP